MTGALPRDAVVVTAGDSGFMGFLRGMVGSLRALPGGEEVALRVLDLGLTEEDRVWLAARGAGFAVPHAHLGIPEGTLRPQLLGFLARPFLRDYFPGFASYFWVDGDAWLQRRECADAFVDGARARGLAVAHERHAAYRFQAWLQGWVLKHLLLGFGPLDGAWLYAAVPVNAGMFCLSDTAPHWDAWAAAYADAYHRSRAVVPHDQFALNRVTAGGLFGRGRLDAAILPPRHNWICDRGPPMWNDAAGAFCEPRAPYAPLGALHLAGPAKREAYAIRRTGGGTFTARLTWGAGPGGAGSGNGGAAGAEPGSMGPEDTGPGSAAPAAGSAG